MHIIKIGQQYINLELIPMFFDNFDQAAVEGVGHLPTIEFQYGSPAQWHCLKGPEAELLRQYLATVAIDPSSPEYTDPDWLEYKANDGDMTFVQWADTKDRLASHLAKSDAWQTAHIMDITRLESLLKL